MSYKIHSYEKLINFNKVSLDNHVFVITNPISKTFLLKFIKDNSLVI